MRKTPQNRQQSKYFATAARMDDAFLALLEKKDFAYITVKEICAAAGVNRSTFYLHYETLGDLLAETPEYLVPYLSYVREHQRLFSTALAKAGTLGLDVSYRAMARHVFAPILDRLGVVQKDRPYLMAFYVHGLMAIVEQWLADGCGDSIEHVVAVIEMCVQVPGGE